MTSTSELTPEGEIHPVTSSRSVDEPSGAVETHKDIRNLNDVILAEDLRRTLAIRAERDAGVIDNSERTAEAGEMVMGAIHLGDSHVHHYEGSGKTPQGQPGPASMPVIPSDVPPQAKAGLAKKAALTAALVASGAAGGAGTVAVIDAITGPEKIEATAPEYPGTMFGISSDEK